MIHEDFQVWEAMTWRTLEMFLHKYTSFSHKLSSRPKEEDKSEILKTE